MAKDEVKDPHKDKPCSEVKIISKEEYEKLAKAEKEGRK